MLPLCFIRDTASINKAFNFQCKINIKMMSEMQVIEQFSFDSIPTLRNSVAETDNLPFPLRNWKAHLHFMLF